MQEFPIIFLHGFMGEKTDWEPIIGELTQFKCTSIDLPGHGNNIPTNIPNNLNYEYFAQSIITTAGLIKEKNLVHLVGYSMGGRIALYLAINYPQFFRSIVIESANPGIVDLKEREQRYLQDKRLASKLLENGIEPFVENWYQIDLFKSLSNLPDIKENIIKKKKKNDPVWIARVIEDLSPGIQVSLWNQLPLIKAPVCLIAGELDSKYTKIIHQMQIELAKRKHSLCETHIIPHAGHNAHLERPHDFTDILSKFLKSQQSA